MAANGDANGDATSDVALTRDEVRRVDEMAIREFGIPGLELMETAGRNAAEVVRERAVRLGVKRVVLFAGAGNNGGDGFVIARHLAAGRGAVGQGASGSIATRVWLCGSREKMTADAAANLRRYEKLAADAVDTVDAAGRTDGIETSRAIGLVELIATSEEAKRAAATLTKGDLIIDALLGTGFTGDVREPMATLIREIDAAARATGCQVIAIDLPSGLDCDSGRPSNATIRADLTVTFVAPKVGFARPSARAFTGEVVVRSIGAPEEIVRRIVAARESR